MKESDGIVLDFNTLNENQQKALGAVVSQGFALDSLTGDESDFSKKVSDMGLSGEEADGLVEWFSQSLSREVYSVARDLKEAIRVYDGSSPSESTIIFLTRKIP